MGRAFEKVMEHRKQLTETLRQNMMEGTIFGHNSFGELESPRNPVSQKMYRGVNRVALMLAVAERGYQDPRWMTFDQIKSQSYHLKKGSKGVLCEYWDLGQEKEEETELQENPQQPKVGYYYVYNAEDVDGIDSYRKKERTVNEQEEIRDILQENLSVQKESVFQNEMVRIFTEMEYGILGTSNVSFEKESFLTTAEIVRAIQRAQLQSEDIISQYEKSLFQESEFVEHVPVVLEHEQIENTEQAELPEQITEYAEVSQNEDIRKIEDFGRKIGGAKKDNWKQYGLRVEDILGMTSGEREKYITKDNIWKKPDYDVMMADGLPKKVAWFIKRTRDKLRSKPGSQEYQEGYIAFVQDLKNSIMNVKTEQDCIEFYREFLIKKKYIVPKTMYGVELTEKCADAVDRKLFNALRVGESDFKYRFEREMAKAQFGVPAEDKLPPGVTICYFHKAEKYMVYKGGVNYASCDSREEAVKYAKENLCRSKVRKQSFIPPQLTVINRDNLDEVVKEPVTGQDYLDTYNFYGGEFGNWMTAADRQQSLNMGYEAFHDLAVALDIDEKEISFGGKLAIAFGSRGSGNAMAHYEPLRHVINLTKMKGAGSLAHEWGHALDNILAEELGGKWLTGMGVNAPESVNILLKTMKYKDSATGRELTDFYSDAKKLDEQFSKCDKGYWASDQEMFARAFACYVKDKLYPGISDYLCGHADIGTLVEMDTKKIIRAYPAGEERNRINLAMEHLIKELKEKKLLLQKEPEEISLHKKCRVR